MYTLGKIAEILGATCYGDEHIRVDHLTTDTRKTMQQHSLFVAIKTKKNNGHNYLQPAHDQGAAALLVSSAPHIDVPYILVPDTLIALQKLAQQHRETFNIPVVAITGSNGKTIVKEWVSFLLATDYKVCKSPKSYNSQIGVPFSVWQLNTNHSIGVFEAGISKPNEMEHLRNVIKPTIGVFTHLGDAHAIHFDSAEQKLEEKLKLFEACEMVVCSGSQPNVVQAIQKLGKKTFTWGSNIVSDLHITRSMSGSYTLTYQRNSYNIALENTDKASVENTFTSLATALAIGVDIESIIPKISELPHVDMRLQEVEGIQDNQLILDYYNSDFQSIGIALDFLQQQKSNSETCVIISDITESTLPPAELYSKLNALLVKNNITEIIGIGTSISSEQHGFALNATFYKDKEDFLKRHPIHLLKNKTILIKGARKFAFEHIAERLKKKTHQTVLEVNLTRLQNNLDTVKLKVGKQTKVMAMVKALAYGSGGYQIAKLLENNKIDYLGVAYTDEATQLRASGINTPIMVLNPDLTDLSPYFDFNIQPVIYSFSSLEKVKNSDLKIHLEIDTGMHRLGFVKEEIDRLIHVLKDNKQLKIASVFSHLSAADDPEIDGFTQGQISNFEQITKKIKLETGINFLSHISNTAAIERFLNASFDMVRLGIGLYGISTQNEQSDLQPVGTFKSYISQIKNVPANEGIGYGQHDKADLDRKIAVVAIGYADGFSRSFSQGKGAFLINGKSATVVGNVCMDMTMCEVTHIDCKEGDEVLIFGDNPSVEQLAERIGTIPYEILTNVSDRVNRVFYQE